jgi:predicted HNH restriction endonuclease
MPTPPYGTAKEYQRAFAELEREGIHFSHRDFLLAHFALAERPVTWRQLGTSLGYADGTAVNLQYGTFARRVGRKLPLRTKPLFWLHVIAEWAGKDTLGEQAFVMRPEVATALKHLGWVPSAQLPSPLDTEEDALEGRHALKWVNHRHREAKLRRRKIEQALSSSPDGKLRCTVPQCGFSFEEVYGAEAHRYAQVHHLVPLSRLEAEQRTRLEDLVVICANCHALIHLLDSAPPFKRLVHRARRRDA